MEHTHTKAEQRGPYGCAGNVAYIQTCRCGAETAMNDLMAAGSDIETLLGWRVEEVMETYLIAEVLGTGDWGIIEEFEAKDDEAANAYAEEHYSHIEWYVLYQSTHVNING